MKTPPSPLQLDEASKLEEEARTLFREKRIEEAFQAYREAALLYRHAGHPQKASHCFAQASLCEKIRTGFQSVREAALMSDFAARESVKAGEFALAKWLFREAGLLYEKEGEFEDYSRTFIEAQEAHMKFLRHTVIHGKKQTRFPNRAQETVKFKERLESLISYGMGLISKLIWRYGEAPLRPIVVGALIILFCAAVFTVSGPVKIGLTSRVIDFKEALYMSSVTFTTVGYGDYVPLGWVRAVSILEAFSGIMLMPLFVIALTRRFLRVYR